MGLSEGEGQDATRAWWVRSVNQDTGSVSVEVLDAGWDNWVLSDIDPSGTRVVTTPHSGGPLLVRAFPSLDILRAIDPPREKDAWDFTACFAGDLLVSKLIVPQERLVAIGQDDMIHELGKREDGWLIQAPHGTWLTVTRSSIRRCRAIQQA